MEQNLLKWGVRALIANKVGKRRVTLGEEGSGGRSDGEGEGCDYAELVAPGWGVLPLLAASCLINF